MLRIVVGSGHRWWVVGWAVAVGACDASSAEVSYDEAPDTQITAAPPALGDVGVARFEFSSDDELAEFECRVDDRAFEPCSSPAEYPVAQGDHLFEVRAVDLAGNVDETPATHGWTYDLDECALGTHACHELASCSNYVAGYECQCLAGYVGDGRSCENFDECAGRADDCSATAQCIDTDGSFSCIGDDPAVCLTYASATAVWQAEELGALDEATIELWYKGSHGQLFTLATSSCSPASVTVWLRSARALGFDALSGPVVALRVDSSLRGGESEFRAFAIEPALRYFDYERWHHYAVVITASGHRVFVDGVELTETQQLLGVDPVETLRDVFDGPVEYEYFETVPLYIPWVYGQMEDVRISSVGRYDASFLPSYPLELDDDTVALYPLDEGSGTISYDRGPGRHHLQWSDNPWRKCPIPSTIYRSQSGQGSSSCGNVN